ncbi:MAG TPA: DUF4886 domain-containing protein [Anaerolineales bacterium]|nr:DUF4886 domain-containing protein [Anaerolineales bacterium]
MSKKPHSLIRCFYGLCLALLCLAACGASPSTHILLIGNSYTYINGGLDSQLKGLAPGNAVSMVAVGGYTLRDHWNSGTALQTVRTGKWNYVVLQEQSQTPVTDREKFFNAVRDFDMQVRASGGETILLMTWERPDSLSFGVTTDNLAAAYNAVGSELGIKVAPAGVAFAESLRERPDLVLNNPDGHPTIYGTYLAACVLYGTIFGKTPAGNPYSDRSISPEIRDFLQGIAAKSLGY